MTSRFVCTVLVVSTEEKALILVKLIVSMLCGLDADFLRGGPSPCQGVGECVFFQEHEESSAITASCVLVAQHSAEGME